MRKLEKVSFSPKYGRAVAENAIKPLIFMYHEAVSIFFGSTNVLISVYFWVSIFLGSKAPFTRDRIQMESDPLGSDPIFEGRLHGIGSRTVGVYTGSDPFRFYELLAAL